MIERLPRARGPNSMRPWNRPTTASSATSRAISRGQLALAELAVGITVRVEILLDLAGENSGPRNDPRIESCESWIARGLPSSLCQTSSAAPRAPPASPAAGWIHRSSNESLAQESTVGHAVEGHAAGQAELRLPVRRWACARHAQHDLLGHHLDRARDVHLAPRERALRVARAAPRRAPRTARSSSPARRDSRSSPCRGGTSRRPCRSTSRSRISIDVAGLSVGRQAHQLVLAGVHLEAREVGERRVEQSRASAGMRARALQAQRVAPSPTPIEAVAHSPTPSIVRTAASANGEG